MIRLSTPGLPAAVVVATTVLTAYSTGPTGQVGDATGSPAQTTACSSCHNGGSYEPETELSLLDADGTSQTSYTAGETYTLRVSIAGADEAVGYGFQAVAIDADVEQAGAFGQPPEGTRVSPFGGAEYLEHARRLAEPLVEIDWTAPEAGTGEVTVYAAGNAVNGGGTSGDNVDLATLVIAEAGAPSVDTAVVDTAVVDTTSAVRLGLPRDAWSAYGSAPGRIRVEAVGEIGVGTRAIAFDAGGRELARRELAGGSADLDLGSVAGVVVVRLVDPEGRAGTRRVVVTQ